ncbi:MAG TPA: DJ-1/PfpI family protein [Solirubrobacteraceae bacterium]|jgi:transcriptional regulator GlxA family with amidase domain|nr:DJ-1/PfpI family protein [Solirubrobacteraceae bacterium]
MDIAIPIFDQITALDAIGPYEVLSRIPGARVTFVAKQPGPKRTENGMLALVADRSLDELTDPDVIVVPGGFGTRPLARDEELLAWLRHAHEHSTWTTSVCTGALLLAAAGILNGLRATTHWLQYDLLRPYGVTPVDERIVREGKIITAAGVSAGIDMALMLAAEIAGPELAQGIQLGIEYDPEPPFKGGSLRSAPPEIVELVRRRADELA